MTAQPLVSVLISNHNYGRFLGEAIDSALAQTYPRVEVVVVDDGSTDDSRAIVAGYGDRVVPVLKENGGLASAWNAGFAASRGEVVCLLDADDVFKPHKVERVAQTFLSSSEIGWCADPIERVRAEDRIGDAAGLERLPPAPRLMPPGPHDFREQVRKGTVPWAFPPTPGLSFRRTLLDRVLPMPETGGNNLDDSYLKFTGAALTKGWMLDNSVTIQRIHGANAFTMRTDKQALTARKRVLEGYWLRRRFPEIAPLAHKLMARGIAGYARLGDLEAEYAQLIEEYLDSVDRVTRVVIHLRAFHHRWLRRTA